MQEDKIGEAMVIKRKIALYKGDLFLKQEFLSGLSSNSGDYIETIRAFDDSTVRVGVSWPSSITCAVETGTNALLPAFYKRERVA